MLRNSKIEKNLAGGLSGCLLEISGDGKIVTKTSSGSSYDQRLLLQADKQKKFYESNIIHNIKCPEIFGIHVESSPFKFQMSYASGVCYGDFLNYSPPATINSFKSSIVSYIESLRGYEKNSYSDSEFRRGCLNKLSSIEGKIEDKKFLDYLKSRIEKCSNVFLPETFCHGDLTLSNILFSKDLIYFVDFLDSYIESWIIDLIKLKQDLYYFWSLSRMPMYKNMRSIQTSLHIWNCIEEKYQGVTSSEEFKILEVLNFLRIYPYVTCDNEKNILKNIIKKLPLYEEFNNPNGREIV